MKAKYDSTFDEVNAILIATGNAPMKRKKTLDERYDEVEHGLNAQLIDGFRRRSNLKNS